MDALHALTPVSDAYAHLPVADAFDWTAAGEALGTGEWYMVAFRSVRRPDADESMLTEYDERAHAEAAASEGYLHYFKGPLASDETCLSFCIWTSRAAARAAAGKPLHAEAAALVGRMYDTYRLEFLRLQRSGGGRLTFEPYDGPATPGTKPPALGPLPSPA